MQTVLSTKIETSKAAAKAGANTLRQVLSKQPEASIILATGTSQFDMLNALIEESGIEWWRVTGFHLDEYAGLPITHPASFRKYLWDRFVSRLPYPMKAFHFIEADTSPNLELPRLNRLLSKHKIDIAFIGIGENAHLAFNDPPADFDTEDPYILVELDDQCRQQQLGEGWFATLKEVPEKAISMSIRQIMKSDAIICTVPEKRKANAVYKALKGPVSPTVPASALQRHPNCHLFLDEDSASELP